MNVRIVRAFGSFGSFRVRTVRIVRIVTTFESVRTVWDVESVDWEWPDYVAARGTTGVFTHTRSPVWVDAGMPPAKGSSRRGDAI